MDSKAFYLYDWTVVKKLLGDENALKKKEILYNDKIKRIDHFFNDLKVGMRNLIERVHEMGML